MKNKLYHQWVKRALVLACAAQTSAFAQELASAHATPETGNREVRQASTRLLKQVLKELEAKYGIFFTYRNAALEDKLVRLDSQQLPPANASRKQVDATITSLLNQQQLKFKKVDNIYVIFTEEEQFNIRQIKRKSNLGEENNGNETAQAYQQVAFTGINNFQSLLEAKDVAVKGRVTDENGAGLPGVTILVKGTSNGTTTDANGNYSLNVPDNATLVFSFIGYVAEEVAVGAQTTVNVTLMPDVKALNEVVVVGYGTQQKKDLVGSVGVANAKDFGDVNVSTVSQLVQGKIAGVQVVNNNGLPGAGTNIVVRGTGSFTNVTPLYVIDGIQSDVNTFNSLSPYDIQDITVLKDASSIAIYGAQGANGVVIVTTKKARTGAPKVTYNGYFGLAQPWKKLDLLNASQYIDLVRDIASAQGTTVPDKLNTPDVLVDRTDWQDEMFRTAQLTEHHIGVGGGTEKITYNVSLGYTNQESIMTGYSFQRFNLRFNLEENLGKRFRFGQQLNVRYSINRGQAPDLIAGIRMPPYAPIYDPSNLGGYSKVTTIQDLNDAFNPLTDVYLRDKRDRNILNYAQLYGEVDLIKGLKFRTQASINFSNTNGYNYIRANQNGNLNNPNGITEYYSSGIYPLIENFFTYNREFGVHNLTVTAGNSFISSGTSRLVNVSGSNFPNDDIRQVGVAPNSSLTGGNANSGTSLISYFGRVNYSLFDKYLLSLSFRRDGSSVFGRTNRWGNFPSVGIGWRISEEEFFKNITFISDLKIRASWGKTGNAKIGNYLYEPYVFKGTANNIVYSLGNNKNYVQGATVNRAVNPDIKWEETVQSDIGLDVGLLNNALNFTLDFYNRQNNDLLIDVLIPPSTGIGGTGYVGTSQFSNAASAYNRGVELSAGYNGSIGNFKYSISANGAYNQNKVTSLGSKNASAIIGGGFEGVASITRTEPGHPIGAYYGYKVDHVAIDQADVNRYNEMAKSKTGDADAIYQESLRPGDIIFQDLDGDGRVTEKDQTYIGSPVPKWNYGANINLGYKNFDLMLSLQGIAGVDLVNGLKYWTEGTTRPFNSSTAVLNRWRQEGDVTDIPRAGQNANSNLNLRPSDRYIESGAYMRVRNLTLGYTIPTPVLNQLTRNTVSSFRVYLTAQNLLTFTKYTGYDPEVSAQDPNSATSFLFGRGINLGQYPQPRTFMIGLQVGF